MGYRMEYYLFCLHIKYFHLPDLQKSYKKKRSFSYADFLALFNNVLLILSLAKKPHLFHHLLTVYISFLLVLLMFPLFFNVSNGQLNLFLHIYFVVTQYMSFLFVLVFFDIFIFSFFNFFIHCFETF